MARRPLAWGSNMLSQVIVANAGLTPLNLLTDLAASDTITAIRLVGRITVVPSDASATNSGVQRIDFGVGVSASEAFTANVLPDANAGGEQPARGWLWRDSLVCVHEDTVKVHYFGSLTLDIRSMRKVDRGVLYLTAFSTTMSGTGFTTRMIGILRVLCAT